MPWCVFDIAGREKIIVDLEKQASVPGFWQDRVSAEKVMRRLAGQQKMVSVWRGMEKGLADTLEMLPLAAEDDVMAAELQAETDALAERLEQQELELAFTGEYDDRNAILSIHAGAGGTESQDWAEMLLRMYLRWAERRGYQTEVLDTTPGEEAGIKSVVVSVRGDHAAGYLKSEHGVHRLVRLSPFDADHARHTSFALVEVIPEAEEDVDLTVVPEDLKVEVFRSSGPGGQHMQKTSSAVRITHLASGITVTCQSERSQFQNKDIAMRILNSRLLEREIRRREEEISRLKGKHVSAGWGNQIRSYVLHPYRMVKDHRSDYQSSNPDGVLEGDLDGLMRAYMRATMSGQE
jgi:peptide chain release factor 2